MHVIKIPVDSDALESYRRELTLPDIATSLELVARVIASEIVLKDLTKAILVISPGDHLTLMMSDMLDNEGLHCFASQVKTLSWLCKRLRYVPYHQVEQDCERLAVQLRERFGRRELADFRFVAMPRGGFIVLGMLAYILDLDRAQLEVPASLEIPLVVVDDCALTGFRFGQFLKHCENPQIIFVPLYAHPDLRTAIATREPRVLDCLSAQDLHDYSPERLGEDYPAWREQKLAQMGVGRYWVGQTEHLCFAWNEPDRLISNSATGKLERGWHIVPPGLCLKNRFPPSAESITVQVQPRGQGPLRPSERVVFGDLGNEIIVGDLESEKSIGLRDSAADIWRAIIEYGNLEEVVPTLQQAYGVEAAALQADVHAFANDLLTRGLLVWDA